MIKKSDRIELSIKALSSYGIEPNIIKTMLEDLKATKQEQFMKGLSCLGNIDLVDGYVGTLIQQAKQNTGLKSKELAKFLGVAEPTLYYWEKHDIWPSWALKKCGIL